MELTEEEVRKIREKINDSRESLSIKTDSKLRLTSFSDLVRHLISLEIKQDVQMKFGLDQSIDFVTAMVQVFALYMQGNSKFKYLFEFDNSDELNQAINKIKNTLL